MTVKKIVLLGLMVIGTGGMVRSQVLPPALINYDGVLRDGATGLPLNATVDLLFDFYADPASMGNDILKDTHAGVVVTNGSFNVQLGGGVVTDGAGSGSYTSLITLFRDFSGVWMEIRVTSPFSETLSPRVRMLGSAYAMNAAQAADAAHLGGKLPAEILDTTGTAQIKAGGLVLDTLLVNGATSVAGALAAASLSINGPSSFGGGPVMRDGIRPVSSRTPLQIATLHWYTAAHMVYFDTGNTPVGMAFDGSNIWVANSGDDTVMKLRASDGSIQGTYPSGATPTGLAFDGTSIWVANRLASSVTKLRASDGANLGTFSVGGPAHGVTFDGSNIWVTIQDGPKVMKLRASDGENLGVFQVDQCGSIGPSPFGIVFDGSSIWAASSCQGIVRKLRASDGFDLGTIQVGGLPQGLAFDGSSIWVAGYSSNCVTKVKASDGTVLGTYSVGTNPSAVAFDGSSIWIVHQTGVTKLRASDGALLTTAPLFSGYGRGISFDGSSIWVIDPSVLVVWKL